jgi:hypothetical protein
MNLRQNIKFADLSSGLGDGLRGLRLSPVEVVFLVAALVFGAVVVFFYFNRVQPLRSELIASPNSPGSTRRSRSGTSRRAMPKKSSTASNASRRCSNPMSAG